MKKNQKIFLFFATIFFLIAFSGIAFAYTISTSTANIERRYGISNVVKIGSILYTAFPDVSGIYEQVKFMNSSDGGITWHNAYTSAFITTDSNNKTLSKSLVVNGKIYIFYFKPSDANNYFKVFDVTTGILSSEYSISMVTPAGYDYDVIFGDNGYIYIAGEASGTMYIGEIRTSDNTLIYSNSIGLVGSTWRSIKIMQDSTGDIYLVAVGDATRLRTIYTSDYGRTLTQSNSFTTGSAYFLRAGIDEYDTIYEIYSKDGSPNTLELYYKNYSGAWAYGLTNITNFDYLHYIQDSSNDMFFLNGSFYFNYMDVDGNFSLGYFDKGTSRLQKAIFSNNLYFGGNIRSKDKSAGVIPSTIDLIVGNFSNGYMVNPFKYSFFALNPSTFLEGFSGGGGTGGTQGGGSGYFCAFYRYYFDWLNLNDYCLFADSFDYSRNVSLSAYLNGVDYSVANGTLASANGWNYSTECDISNHPVPSYFSQSVKDGAGGITEGSDICQNISYYPEHTIQKVFDVPLDLQSKGTFKMVARVIMDAEKGAKSIIAIGKYNPASATISYATFLIIGINDSNGNAFIWYSDGNSWNRASTNAKCDLYFSNTSQYSTFEVRFDLNTKKFDISSVGSVYCDKNFSAPNSAVIGSGLNMFSDFSFNYLDEVQWYFNPDTYGNPEGMTPTFPTLYISGLSDLVISKVLGDNTLETCSYGVMVQDRCNCGNEVAEVGQWCCYEYNSTSFFVFNQYEYQYCGGVGTCRTNVKSEDICLCNGQYNYGRWCCYSVANGYYIGDFNSTFCGTGAGVGAGENVSIEPYTQSDFGDSLATSLGLGSANLKIIGTLLFLILGIIILTIVFVQNGIEGTALILVPSLFVVLGIIFFFVIGWLPFWILFVLVIISAGIFGLFIKNSFGASH